MEQKTVILLLTMLAGMWKAAAVDDPPVEVTTPHGRLRGIRRQVSGSGYVDTFLSIPYARPPVGRYQPAYVHCSCLAFLFLQVFVKVSVCFEHFSIILFKEENTSC